MPCRVEVCAKCGDYYCPGNYQSGAGCIFPNGRPKGEAHTPPQPATPKLDTSGALCDVLSLLEERHPKAFKEVDKKTIAWWRKHEQNEQDKIKKEALAKLTPRERRALGLK